MASVVVSHHYRSMCEPTFTLDVLWTRDGHNHIISPVSPTPSSFKLGVFLNLLASFNPYLKDVLLNSAQGSLVVGERRLK